MKKTIGLALCASILAPMAIGMNTAYAAEENANANSNVTANIQSGGLKLETKDASLGDLVIGQTINPVEVDGLATITDHTGGNGWDLTVKNASYETNKNTLEVGLTMDDTIKLTGEEQHIAAGPSTLAPQDKKGTFTAEWGATPDQGAYSSELNWTLTPNIPQITENEQLKEFMGDATVDLRPMVMSTANSAGEAVNEVMINANGASTSMEKVSANHYEATANFNAVQTGDGGKDSTTGLLMKSLSLTITRGSTETPINEIVESVEFPSLSGSDVMVDDSMIYVSNDTPSTIKLNSDKTKASIDGTVHLKDGTTATITMNLNVAWS